MRAQLGQHFMKNRAAINRIVAELDIRENDTVIEIGPGKGALTIPLARVCAERGAHLIAIERDEELAEEVRRKIYEIGTQTRKVEIVTGDVRERITSYLVRPTSYKIVGNIPYYVTGMLLRLLSESPNPPERAILTVQAEVADRIQAEPPRMNLLAATVRSWATPRVIMRLKPTDFDPPPEVKSAIVALERKHDVLPPETREQYFAICRAVFRHPRKTVWNNLREEAFGGSERVKEALAEAHVDPALRPQNLSSEMLINLAAKLG